MFSFINQIKIRQMKLSPTEIVPALIYSELKQDAEKLPDFYLSFPQAHYFTAKFTCSTDKTDCTFR